MRNLNRSLSAARQSGGFTLVELLVVIGIIAILAGVALGPITSGIRKARESACMQTTRTLALAEFQYANDNNNYPDGADAGVLCAALVSGNYISDSKTLQITGGKAVSPAAGGTIAKANVDYDFTGVQSGGVAVGIPSSAPDGTPLVWSPEPGVSAIPTTTAGLAFAPTTGLFGTDGMAVAYKNNNSFFRTPQAPTPATPTFPGPGKLMFVDDFANMALPGAETYQLDLGAEGY